MLSDCTAMLCKCTLVYDVIFAIVGSVVQGIIKRYSSSGDLSNAMNMDSDI